MLGVVMLTGKEHLIQGTTTWSKVAYSRALPVFGTEVRGRLAGPACWPRNDRQPFGIDGYRTADRKVGIFLTHGPAGHDQQLMHVRPTVTMAFTPEITMPSARRSVMCT